MSEVREPGRASLAGRLLATYAVVFVVLIGLFGVLARSAVDSVLRQQATDTLVRQTQAVALGLRDVSDADLGPEVAARGSVLDARITVVAVDGTVLADSAGDPAVMENHAGRPEVAAALDGRIGVDRRVSDTTGEQQTYVAIPPQAGRIYRMSITEEQSARLAGQLSSEIGLVALVAGVLGVALVALVARRVARPIQELTSIARDVADGHLEVRARRSSIRELDRLGVSIGRMAQELGSRIVATEAEREILEALLDALPQGVVLVAQDDTILYANSTARAVVGEVPDRLSKVTPYPLQVVARDARADGAVRDTAFDAPGGATLRAIASPLPDGRLLLVIADITDRVRIEAMRRDFVADASHELKTPIAAILAATETLELALDRDPERAPRFLGLARESAQQLARIVGDLLDLSRLETSTTAEGAVRLDSVTAEEVDRLRPAAAESRIEVSTDLRPVVVTGSESDLGLAVRNLVSNAIRYSAEGGRVTVTMTEHGGSVRLSVADTGVGIPLRSLPRVFERFYRVDVARSRDSGGTGLGLAIVKHVAESHGGSVSVESELGIGSTFHLVLPVARRAPE